MTAKIENKMMLITPIFVSLFFAIVEHKSKKKENKYKNSKTWKNKYFMALKSEMHFPVNSEWNILFSTFLLHFSQKDIFDPRFCF